MPLWFQNKTTPPKVLAEDEYEKAHHELRKHLIEQYRTRLKSKLAFPMAINIGGKPTTFGTSEGYANDYQLNKDLTIEHDDIQNEIGKILNSHSRLLLIGEAGSGKTTILLFAALDLLTQEDNYQLPLMLNLATWQSDFDFAEWYERNVAESYNLSRAFAKTLIAKKDIVPFFDGFDEINETQRSHLFDKMRTYFGSDRATRFIISSRKLAYQNTAADAPVYAQYEVKPLTIEQIRTALTINQEKFGSENALLNAINQNPHLQEAVLNPFYLNTASFLFEKLGKVEFKALDTEGVQKELVETFVEKQVPSAQDRKYLWFLASNMNKRNMVVFELVNLQYDWYIGKWSRGGVFLSIFLAGLVRALISSLAFGIIIGLVGGLITGLVSGFVACLVHSLVGCLIVSLYSDNKQMPNIKTYRSVKWSLSLFFKIFKEDIISALITGHVIGFVIGFVLSISFGLVFGLISALVYGLIFSLLGVFTEYVKEYNIAIIQINKPYQRFKASIRLLDFSILQHYHLLYLLNKKGLFPFKIVDFLNTMTTQYILESDGATWRFRHKILQDYFAEKKF
jgi:hypothetical protein